MAAAGLLFSLPEEPRLDPSTTLSLTVTLAVLAAAVTHATWNAIAGRRQLENGRSPSPDRCQGIVGARSPWSS